MCVASYPASIYTQTYAVYVYIHVYMYVYIYIYVLRIIAMRVSGNILYSKLRSHSQCRAAMCLPGCLGGGQFDRTGRGRGLLWGQKNS